MEIWDWIVIGLLIIIWDRLVIRLLIVFRQLIVIRDQICNSTSKSNSGSSNKLSSNST